MTTETPSTDLVFAKASLRERMDWARAISQAGELVPAGFRNRDGSPNPAKILLAAETGAMLGLHPMAALNGIHVIDGKATLSAALMSALVHNAHHKLRITQKGTVSGGDFEVTATLIRSDDPKHPFTATWTIDRAKRAELWGKGNWRKYPENQMTWRAVSEAVRNGAPEVLLGAWYTPDEVGAVTTEDGEVIREDLIEDAVLVEDGPESSNPDQEAPRIKKSGHSEETDVTSRPSSDGTRGDAARPGRPRPAQAQAAGAADPTPAEIAADWIGRITDTDTLDALYKLHEEAAARHVLEHTLSTGRSVEDVFLTRREELQNPPESEQPALVPPMFRLDAPAMVTHLRDQHGDRTGMVAQGRPHG